MNETEIFIELENKMEAEFNREIFNGLENVVISTISDKAGKLLSPPNAGSIISDTLSINIYDIASQKATSIVNHP